MSSDDDYLYPDIEPFFKGNLKVSDIHTLYYEQCGNPDGIPVLYIHGGPGGDTNARDRRYFDPKLYHIIIYHQRGAGQSTPPYCLEENDTWSLVDDMEKLREKVGVTRWLLFGGSWGSTLALIYAETHISHVSGLIMRGIFTLRDSEQRWVYSEGGACNLFPEEYEKFIAPIPPEERGDMVKAYFKRLNGSNEEEKILCAKAWNRWELSISYIEVGLEALNRVDQDYNWNLAHSRIECHYFINNGFVKEDEILQKAKIIAESGIPVDIVQGRYDSVCPMKTAWDLHKLLPQSVLHVLPRAGHSCKEEGSGMVKKLVEICDKFGTLLV